MCDKTVPVGIISTGVTLSIVFAFIDNKLYSSGKLHSFYWMSRPIYFLLTINGYTFLIMHHHAHFYQGFNCDFSLSVM